VLGSASFKSGYGSSDVVALSELIKTGPGLKPMSQGAFFIDSNTKYYGILGYGARAERSLVNNETLKLHLSKCLLVQVYSCAISPLR
jgi:hypothetical protein